MKSKNDFKTVEEYKEYLKHYYSGLIMQAQVTVWNGELSTKTREMILKDMVESCGDTIVDEGFSIQAVRAANQLVETLNIK